MPLAAAEGESILNGKANIEYWKESQGLSCDGTNSDRTKSIGTKRKDGKAKFREKETSGSARGGPGCARIEYLEQFESLERRGFFGGSKSTAAAAGSRRTGSDRLYRSRFARS